MDKISYIKSSCIAVYRPDGNGGAIHTGIHICPDGTRKQWGVLEGYPASVSDKKQLINMPFLSTVEVTQNENMANNFGGGLQVAKPAFSAENLTLSLTAENTTANAVAFYIGDGAGQIRAEEGADPFPAGVNFSGTWSGNMLARLNTLIARQDLKISRMVLEAGDDAYFTKAKLYQVQFLPETGDLKRSQLSFAAQATAQDQNLRVKRFDNFKFLLSGLMALKHEIPANSVVTITFDFVATEEGALLKLAR